MARLLSDGVCNAYLLDVWTMSAYRRQGIGTTMVRHLMSRVPGQHIGLQTEDAEAFYASLGYHHQPVFMSAVAGEWLANEANARLRAGDGVIPSPVTATVPGEDGIQRGAVASWRYPDLVTARRLNWASLPGYDFTTGRGIYNCHDQPAFSSTARSSRLTRWGRHTRPLGHRSGLRGPDGPGRLRHPGDVRREMRGSRPATDMRLHRRPRQPASRRQVLWPLDLVAGIRTADAPAAGAHDRQPHRHERGRHCSHGGCR